MNEESIQRPVTRAEGVSKPENTGHAELAEITPEEMVLRLRSWQKALEMRAEERKAAQAKAFVLLEYLKKMIAKSENLADREARLLRSIPAAIDKLAHGTAEHIQAEVAPLFQELQQYYADAISASSESLATPRIESVGAEERFEARVGGIAKKRKLNSRSEAAPQKLGLYGQDVVRANRALGSLAIGDGLGSFDDSFEAARRVTLAAEQVLQNIPEYLNTLSDVEQWVKAHIPDIIHSIDGLPNGGSTLLATRYLPKFDALITIDIGDCEYALVAGETVIQLQTKENDQNAAAAIARSKGSSMLVNPKNLSSRSVASTPLAPIRAQYPGQQLALVQCSDGFANNTRGLKQVPGQKPLPGETIQEIAVRLATDETSSINADYGYTLFDDISYGVLYLPEPEAFETDASLMAAAK